MNILITGVAGFIGSNLADYLLKKGHHIVGIDNLSAGTFEQTPNEVDFHEIDIRDENIFPLFDGIDVAFHLAAKNCISDCQSDPIETADVNVTGTVNVCEACRRSAVGKIIYAESSAIYEGTDKFPTSEKDEVPKSFYAVSKYSAKFFAEAYKQFYKLKMTALRYFNVYGPRQDYKRTMSPLMSAIIIKLLKRQTPIIYGNGTKRRDFIYIDDVNRFHELIMEDTRTDGKTYNVGTGQNYSVLEIYEEIESILKTGVKPVFKPDLPGEAFQNLADISKARQLGWGPKVTLQEGLKRSIDYIKEHVINKEMEIADIL